MGVALIGSRWVSGLLEFFKKSDGTTVLKITESEIEANVKGNVTGNVAGMLTGGVIGMATIEKAADMHWRQLIKQNLSYPQK